MPAGPLCALTRFIILFSCPPAQQPSPGGGTPKMVTTPGRSLTTAVSKNCLKTGVHSMISDDPHLLVAVACNHPNCLVLPFRLELIRFAA
jgi:hypothetical protein